MTADICGAYSTQPILISNITIENKKFKFKNTIQKFLMKITYISQILKAPLFGLNLQIISINYVNFWIDYFLSPESSTSEVIAHPLIGTTPPSC